MVLKIPPGGGGGFERWPKVRINGSTFPTETLRHYNFEPQAVEQQQQVEN